jgi:hypothetical protein
MKSFLFVLALGLPYSFASCSHVTPVVKDCGEQVILSIVDDVNSALATGDWRASLADLVGKFGLCAVTEAVKQVAGQAEVKGRYDDLEATKAQRARQWLSEQSAQ